MGPGAHLVGHVAEAGDEEFRGCRQSPCELTKNGRLGEAVGELRGKMWALMGPEDFLQLLMCVCVCKRIHSTDRDKGPVYTNPPQQRGPFILYSNRQTHTLTYATCRAEGTAGPSMRDGYARVRWPWSVRCPSPLGPGRWRAPLLGHSEAGAQRPVSFAGPPLPPPPPRAPSPNPRGALVWSPLVHHTFNARGSGVAIKKKKNSE